MGDGKADGLIFALDIGTRSVIGVVGLSEGDTFRVLGVESVEHTRRAVVDGQIEDIEQTARIAALVKSRLEAKLGAVPEQVHVAAAGRVLQTCRLTHSMDIDGRRPVDARQVFRLESGAVQRAYEAVLAEQPADFGIDFYCAGHSVMGYSLDGYAFSTLEGHRGRHATVELVAAFLPGEVVESLYATMQRIGLTVGSLTLEPIAAIAAVIPRELRLLNVALVDVGAGTSDIAVASGGSVFAYTMATEAGDEITEHIMRELLVDFQTAEQMKMALGEGADPIAYADILGTAGQIAAGDLFERIRPAVERLAKTVAERILAANNGPPMAVFMVGGGSRTPGLCPLLARALGVDEGKVAVGGSNYMKRLIEADAAYLSPEYATPMGIALSAAAELARGSFTVLLGGKPVPIQSSANATVMEVLLRSGYSYGQIMGRSGRGVAFELNGKMTTRYGGLPTPATVTVNGQPASVNTPLEAGDVIVFEPAVSGEDADTRLDRILGAYEPFSVYIDGELRPAGTWVKINGMPASGESLIRPADKIELHNLFTLHDILRYSEYGARKGRLILNGQDNLPLDTPLKPGDDIRFLTDSSAEPGPNADEPQVSAGAALDTGEAAEPAAVEAMPGATAVAAPEPEAAPSAAPRAAMRVLLNGKAVTLPPKRDGSDFYFFDVLGFSDVDPAAPQGELVILRNGRGASYIEPIQNGDEISVFWKT